jgi:hypothetical protein
VHGYVNLDYTGEQVDMVHTHTARPPDGVEVVGAAAGGAVALSVVGASSNRSAADNTLEPGHSSFWTSDGTKPHWLRFQIPPSVDTVSAQVHPSVTCAGDVVLTWSFVSMLATCRVCTVG